ncbi:carboxypeptidase regulatory-like domain-containing protein [uncultured Paludibaculum sp.]|uniref:TonB-dependent receptor n=1 Tax=uncultured Paludibaculum sp. TaxID=1765020 RepID=UPI002AAC2AF9|nr:carboxypeptidase regulatory-like domain-containing protein [uncultured Paludibaculum sp.]
MAAVLAVSTVLFAQQGRGTIFGNVTDPSGANIAAARVTLRHVETNAVVSTSTSDTGLFTIPAVAVGGYEMRVEADGFRSVVRSGITVRVGDQLRLDVRLELGALQETVSVTGEAPLVDTGSSTVGKVIENERITSLPMNGRNAISLVILTPNVRSHAMSPQGFADRSVGISSFSVNGGPPGNNNITIDGASNINARLGDASVNPSVDAVEEFKVQSGSMSAEYGFTAGGVVNMVTKSGSNQFHGTLYHFLRNDKLDARNAFSAVRPPFRYNQYGGSLGGPIRHDRTFFFYNFEQWNFRNYYNVISTVPTAAERSGDFSLLRDVTGKAVPVYDPESIATAPSGSGFVRQQFPNNVIPQTRLDKVGQNILPYYPLPNRTPSDPFTNSQNYGNNLGQARDARQMTAKLDHQLSNINRLSFRYILWKHKDNNAGTGSGIFPDLIARARYDDYTNHNISLTDTHTFTPTLLNEFRLSAVRQYFPYAAASAGTGITRTLGLPASVPDLTIPTMTIAGYQTFPAGNGNQLGLIGLDTVQLTDSLTAIRGKHTVKMGLEIRRNRYNSFSCTYCSGQFAFSSTLTSNPQSPAGTGSGLASFLLGAVASASGDYNVGTSMEGLSQSYFVQDDWKLARRLTINLGLRYDYQQVPVERHNGLSNFDPFAINPQNGLAGRMEYAGVDYGRSFVQPDRNDFAPRVGFAWDLFGNASTVIRGGYGVYYPLTFMLDYFESSSGFSANRTTYQPAGNDTNKAAFRLQDGFPTPLVAPIGAALGPSAFQSQANSYTQSNGRTPYSQQATLTVQHSLRGGWLLEAGYSGNKGTKLMASGYNYNQLDPAFLSLGKSLQDSVPNPYKGQVAGSLGGTSITRQQSLLPYPWQSSINIASPRMGSSTYHSFLLNAEKRWSQGLVLLGSFTFGKLIGDSMKANTFADGFREQVNYGISYQNGRYDRSLERAVDPTDSAKRFVISGVYELPFGQGKRLGPKHGMLGAMASGWQGNGVLTLQDGLPLVIRGASNFLADRPNSTGTSARLDNPTITKWFDTTAFVNPPDYTFGNVGRTLPDVRAPGLVNLDFSLVKNTRLWERYNIQFRAEAFNVTNRVNLLEPNTSFSPGSDGRNRSGTFGVISSARDPRVVQLGLKLIF